MLVERGAVEVRERPVVAREMPRHPVEDHADAGLVAGVDERAQVVGAAEAAGRREIAGGLVAPRFVERMLGDRHQLDVRVAHVGDVGHQLLGQLAIGVEAAVGMAAPRAGVHFVDAHRRVQPVAARAPRQPVARRPRRSCDGAADARRRAGPQLERARVGIGLDQHRAGVRGCGSRTCTARRPRARA